MPPILGQLVFGAALLAAACDRQSPTRAAAPGSGSAALVGPTTSIKGDEHIELFATTAYVEGDHWVIPLHAWVYEPDFDSIRRRIAVTALGAAIGLTADDASSDIFRTRAWPFLFDNERGKTVVIDIAGQRVVLPESGANGHAETVVRIPLTALPVPAQVTWIDARVAMPASDPRAFASRVQLVPPTGLSILSDIDDTVKITNVLDKRQLAVNTFARPFRAVDGMPVVLSRWAAAGMSMHYLSGSTWQLSSQLAAFFDSVGLPAGVLDLKTVRLLDRSVLELGADAYEFKVPRIDATLRHYPERQFVLVGDSGEKDPEVYAEMMKRYPQQISAIYIRDITGEPLTAPRYQALLVGPSMSAGRWTVFTDPTTLPRVPAPPAP